MDWELELGLRGTQIMSNKHNWNLKNVCVNYHGTGILQNLKQPN